MHGFLRDWRRWTRAERVFAVVIMVCVAAAVPAAWIIKLS